MWYKDHGGAVLSTTIDKYCYINLRYLPPFFKHKHRVVYSKIEDVKSISEIKHPVVRTLLEEFKIKDGVEIHHDGDLPARSGIGSSSSFTVGMIHSLYALKGKIISKEQLAKEAIHVERDILKENVGSQDQIAVTYGGFNKIIFRKDHNFLVEPITMRKERLEQLQSCLMLVFTGISRFASKVAKEQIKNTDSKRIELNALACLVDEAIDVLNGNRDIIEFGKLLNESWKIKRRLSKKISTLCIDHIYDKALRSGAVGGKILGAGGGGFMLLFVPPNRRKKVRQALKGFLEVKFSFENEGSHIIHYSSQ